MKALKIILITAVVLIVAFFGLHVIGLVGVYFYSRAANRAESAKVEPAGPAVQTPPPRAATDGLPTYTVKKGDTLVKIARAHGVSPEELRKLNNLEDPNKIQLAQVLQLPRKEPQPL